MHIVSDTQIIVERSDWSAKITDPQADTVWPVVNLVVGGLYFFASVSVEDDPPNDHAWIVFVYETDGPRLRSRELCRVQSKQCYPEEEAIGRASRAIESLFTVMQLGRLPSAEAKDAPT